MIGAFSIQTTEKLFEILFDFYMSVFAETQTHYCTKDPLYYQIRILDKDSLL
tara:strand:- start:115 stop:270 length:156 start_codon:yes stop_codon:yes gene_type:complete